MCCNAQSLLTQLKDLVCQIDDNKCGSCAPCSPCVGPTGFTEPCFPFAQVVMTCPPPIMLPTSPRPVKPLQLPCPPCPQEEELPTSSPYDRYANFYNNYNVIDGDGECGVPDPRDKLRQCGMTVDGQSAKCEEYKKKKKNPIICKDTGCPTGFKPCRMELFPPPLCDPWGVWCAKIQPCPPKPKVSGNKGLYDPPPCTRPCCKHWKPEGGPCLYDAPCKAHCFNHPPGIKPSGKTVY